MEYGHTNFSFCQEDNLVNGDEGIKISDIKENKESKYDRSNKIKSTTYLGNQEKSFNPLKQILNLIKKKGYFIDSNNISHEDLVITSKLRQSQEVISFLKQIEIILSNEHHDKRQEILNSNNCHSIALSKYQLNILEELNENPEIVELLSDEIDLDLEEKLLEFELERLSLEENTYIEQYEQLTLLYEVEEEEKVKLENNVNMLETNYKETSDLMNSKLKEIENQFFFERLIPLCKNVNNQCNSVFTELELNYSESEMLDEETLEYIQYNKVMNKNFTSIVNQIRYIIEKIKHNTIDSRNNYNNNVDYDVINEILLSNEYENSEEKDRIVSEYGKLVNNIELIYSSLDTLYELRTNIILTDLTYQKEWIKSLLLNSLVEESKKNNNIAISSNNASSSTSLKDIITSISAENKSLYNIVLNDLLEKITTNKKLSKLVSTIDLYSSDDISSQEKLKMLLNKKTFDSKELIKYFNLTMNLFSMLKLEQNVGNSTGSNSIENTKNNEFQNDSCKEIHSINKTINALSETILERLLVNGTALKQSVFYKSLSQIHDISNILYFLIINDEAFSQELYEIIINLIEKYYKISNSNSQDYFKSIVSGLNVSNNNYNNNQWKYNKAKGSLNTSNSDSFCVLGFNINKRTIDSRDKILNHLNKTIHDNNMANVRNMSINIKEDYCFDNIDNKELVELSTLSSLIRTNYNNKEESIEKPNNKRLYSTSSEIDNTSININENEYRDILKMILAFLSQENLSVFNKAVDELVNEKNKLSNQINHLIKDH